jgi:uncharacterized glyoxalase superfamily protein PhnB
MIVEVYSDGTVVVQGNNQLDKILDSGATLLYTIEGEDWDDCIQKYYDKNGWGTYVPFDK